jgi:hypothetical protein
VITYGHAKIAYYSLVNEMRCFIGVTDNDWFEYLSKQTVNIEEN